MIGTRLHQLVAKVGLPMIALMAAAGLSTAVAATYLTFTADSSVGSFSPDGVPVQAGDTTSTSAPTVVVIETTTTTVAGAPVPTSTPTTAPVRGTATTRATTRQTVAPAQTTTTACSNSGKGNCRSRSGGSDDDPGKPDDD